MRYERPAAEYKPAGGQNPFLKVLSKLTTPLNRGNTGALIEPDVKNRSDGTVIMVDRTGKGTGREIGFLRRLARDKAGNTLALVAASIAPLLALVGGGIDMGRSYLSQSRLQQACDAGVLAARKKLGSSAAAGGEVPAGVADIGSRFFNINFRDGAYGTEDRAFTMTLDDDYAISGTAKVRVPTTIMRIFGDNYVDLTVACQAQINFPDSDIMMVLDTTGSMNQKNYGDTETKIQVLRDVVKAFHAQVEGSKSPGTTIRYGFVPYSANVNVGYLLKSGWMVDEWHYDARVARKASTNTTVTNYDETQAAVGGSYAEIDPYSSKSCPESDVVLTVVSSTSNPDGSSAGRNSVNGNYYYCDYDPDTGGMTVNGTTYNTYVYDWTRVPNGTIDQDNYTWQYRPIKVDVSSLKGASDDDVMVGGSIGLPIGGSGPSSAPSVLTATFEGCIEERDTYDINDYDKVDLTRALDLDIDLVPDPSDPGTQWRPLLPQLSYERAIDKNFNGSFNQAVVNSDKEMLNARSNVYGSDYSVCPSPARKLAPMSADEIASYVDSLVAKGNTYHDIGMIWGGRLLSPTGIFADENNGSANLARHLIFLTDGETAPNQYTYGTYGIEPIDGRRWSKTSKYTLTQTVENRFSVACDQVKSKNITVWVIGFGTNVTDMLKNCAGDGHWFQADNAEDLSKAFETIGNSINELRITR